MQLKNQEQIDVAIKRGKVPPTRAQEIVTHIRATRPEKMDELDAIFSEHLPPEEKTFYHDIVENRSETVAPAPGEAPATSHEPES